MHTRNTTPPFVATRALRAIASIGLLGFVLIGCAAPEPVTPAPDSAPPAEIEVAPSAVFIPGGTAGENEPYFSQTLQSFAASEQPVVGMAVVDALAAAGFDKAAMQVSLDQSRTGLVADSILASVQLGSECLIGQVVTSDRSVTTTVQPALTEAQNICLIGNTRPIDW